MYKVNTPNSVFWVSDTELDSQMAIQLIFQTAIHYFETISYAQRRIEWIHFYVSRKIVKK